MSAFSVTNDMPSRGAEGVIVAWDVGGDALILQPEGATLGEALWLWSHENVPVTKHAPSLRTLLDRRKPKSLEAQLVAQANEILAGARKKRPPKT